jgi:hypothetical protein
MDKSSFLINEGRQIILKYLPLNSCISSTRIAIEFLKPEINLYAQPVWTVANKNGLNIIGRNPELQSDDWQGHLVAMGDKYLIDMSIDQVGLAPFYINNIGKLPIAIDVGGSGVVYFCDEHNENFLETNAWENLYQEPLDDIINSWKEWNKI